MELIKTITKEASDYFWEKIKRADLDEEASEKISEIVREAIENANDIMWQADKDIDYIIEKEATPRMSQNNDLEQCEMFVNAYQLGGGI